MDEKCIICSALFGPKGDLLYIEIDLEDSQSNIIPPL